MKTSIRVLILALTVALAACSNGKDDNPNPTGNKVDQVAGAWKVSYFFDSGKDETYKFTGYNFNFNSSGTLTANGSPGNFTGTWRIGQPGDDDDSSSDKLVIFITGNDAMDELQDDWLIIRLTDQEIWLKDDSDSSVEELRFEKV